MERSRGAELAVLLLRGFRSMVDDVTTGLAHHGHPGVRPADEFALRAIDGGADTASRLARSLSITKQAAAQRITVLEQMGYIDREVDAVDARRKRLLVTPRGYEMMTIGGTILDEVRSRWAGELGLAELDVLEAHLVRLTEGVVFTSDGLSDD